MTANTTASVIENPVNRISLAMLDDPQFQMEIERDAREAFTTRNLHVAPDVELQVHTNTEDLIHIVFPPDPNVDLSDEALSVVAGGKSASSAACGGSASSVCTAPSCASSASSASTASSAASAS